MEFTDQARLQDKVTGQIGLNGSPYAVQYRDKLYVIYNGAGGDGLYFVTFDGTTWDGPHRLGGVVQGVGVADNSSPTAVVVHDVLYIFYNGAGNDGTHYITYDGNDVKGPISIKASILNMSFKKGTSPAATTYGYPYVFWVGGGDDGIFYTMLNRNTWTGQTNVKTYLPGIGIADGTSATAIEYMADFYLFYNGSGGDGTYYAVLKNDGWNGPVGIKGQIGGMGFRGNTSPSVCLSGGSFKILLFWAGSGQDGIYVSAFDGTGTKTWAAQERIKCPNQTPGILDGTSPCATLYNQTPYLFWNGVGNDGIYFTTVKA